MSTIARLVSPKGLSILVNGKFIPVLRDHRNYNKIVEALNANDATQIEALLDVNAAFTQWKGSLPGDFEVRGALLYHNGKPFREVISSKILRMAEEGLDPDSFLNFLRKLRQNPAFSAQQELLLFCEANDFMIHTDGDLIAYKAVRDDYRDQHTGTVLNKLAADLTEEERAALPFTTDKGVTVAIESNGETETTVVTMERGEVDDDRRTLCSFGLHFAAYSYASGFSRRVMVVKIHPRDVVAIPADHNNQKGRCCRYEVIAEREGNLALTKHEVYTDESLGVETREATEDTTRESRYNELLSLVKEILAKHSRNYGVDFIDQFESLETLGIEQWQYSGVTDDIAALTEHEVSLDIDYRTDADDLVKAILSAEDSALLEQPGLHDDHEDDDGDDEDGDKEDVSDEDIKAFLATLKDSITRRIITNSAQFRQALIADDLDPDDHEVIAVIQEEGLGGWL